MSFKYYLMVLAACQPQTQNAETSPAFGGGGEDALTMSLPFEEGYQALCTQGPFGETSHNYTSTRYDIDLDTPNDRQDPVYAPYDGVAYVHDDPTSGFGIHVNIDLGDGTYLIMAHLEETFIDNESEVAAGQLLGYEGSTGDSSGDHVHFGRHTGDASLDGTLGMSFDGLILDMLEESNHVQLQTTEMLCDLIAGNSYESLLKTSLWHPNGSLVKTPDQATVYLVQDGGLTPFITEPSFLTRNFDFAEVALISPTELACYPVNPGLTTETEIQAIYGAGTYANVWLLIGAATDTNRERLLVPSVGWQGVLKSWGIIASTYDDLVHDAATGGVVPNYAYGGTATYRDGSLVSPLGKSDVYVMTDGVAMPIISWETLLFSGWEDRTILEVAQVEFDTVVTSQGDCATDTYCYTLADAQTCGGPADIGNPSPPPPPVGGGEVPTPHDLVVTWTTPGGIVVDSITLEGALTEVGQPEGGWEQADGGFWAQAFNKSTVSVTVPGLMPGDSFRFSAESLNDGVTDWSCLGPFPPGIIQGSPTAVYNGKSLTLLTADDPLSDGCTLMVTAQ